VASASVVSLRKSAAIVLNRFDLSFIDFYSGKSPFAAETSWPVSHRLSQSHSRRTRKIAHVARHCALPHYKKNGQLNLRAAHSVKARPSIGGYGR
jgi:hypothetical protein